MLADSFLADLLLAAGGREAEGDVEQKFNLLIPSNWHSRSRRGKVFSCEVAKGEGKTGVLKTQPSGGFCSICPGPGTGQRLANLLLGALQANLPSPCSVIPRGTYPCQASAGKVSLRLVPGFCRISHCVNPPAWMEQQSESSSRDFLSALSQTSLLGPTA